MAGKKFDFKKMPVQIGGITLGVAGGKYLKKMMPNANPLYTGGVAVIAGAVLPSFIKNDFVENIGYGLIAAGADILLDKFVPGISGIGANENEYVAAPGEAVSNEYLMSGLGLVEENQGLGATDNDGLGATEKDGLGATENDGLGATKNDGLGEVDNSLGALYEEN